VKPATVLLLCAWVLWSEMPPGSGRWRLADTLQVAFERKAECDRALSDLNDARALSADEVATKGGSVPPAFHVCLPESIDPRGPKAGGPDR
jgi:hypothetical protein